jgi:hypothetical protein
MIDMESQRTRTSSAAAGRLTSLAGWSLIVIAVLHTLVFVPQAPWGDWVGGSLRTAEPDMESVAIFWALPGGFVVPGLLAGLLIIKAGRRREPLHVGIAAALFLWCSGCIWLAGPSGFMFFYVTVGFLTAASIAARRASARIARPAR